MNKENLLTKDELEKIESEPLVDTLKEILTKRGLYKEESKAQNSVPKVEVPSQSVVSTPKVEVPVQNPVNIPKVESPVINPINNMQKVEPQIKTVNNGGLTQPNVNIGNNFNSQINNANKTIGEAFEENKIDIPTLRVEDTPKVNNINRQVEVSSEPWNNIENANLFAPTDAFNIPVKEEQTGNAPFFGQPVNNGVPNPIPVSGQNNVSSNTPRERESLFSSYSH